MQFLIFLVFVMLIGSIFFAKKDALTTRSKIIFIICLGLFVLFAWLYEESVSTESQEYRVVLNAFKQGKTLYCDGVDVSAQKFVFISGTLSFIASDKNQEHKGLVIDIATCKTEK